MTKRKRPARPCSWSSRCYTRPTVRLNDDERYCKSDARKVADRYVGLFVKERDRWTCQSCSKRVEGKDAQYAHVISRGARYVQYEPDNAFCLCAGCHFHFTNQPHAWSVWLAVNHPGLHDRMSLLEADGQRSGGSVDLAEVILHFRAAMAERPAEDAPIIGSKA
jgi:hypothetical protein